ncbi:hypothetical protein ACFSUS_23360 [Spirosoma soli]|uniref:DUF4332 domain-containing protein n=1 Tax=Spirosoma soli TaxID=1770529 RepID=A0ABW5M9A8_9BACT
MTTRRPNTEEQAHDGSYDQAQGLPMNDNEDSDAPVGDVIDSNTTFDVYVSSTGFVTELSDRVDAMDGAAVEVVDIVNQADGTNIELTIIEEPTDKPNVSSVDRFVEIKGIGPNVADVLIQAGIERFSQLAETPVERIREILSEAGAHYRIYDATSWPEQAKLLAENKQHELNAQLKTQRIGQA